MVFTFSPISFQNLKLAKSKNSCRFGGCTRSCCTHTWIEASCTIVSRRSQRCWGCAGWCQRGRWGFVSFMMPMTAQWVSNKNQSYDWNYKNYFKWICDEFHSILLNSSTKITILVFWNDSEIVSDRHFNSPSVEHGKCRPCLKYWNHVTALYWL